MKINNIICVLCAFTICISIFVKDIMSDEENVEEEGDATENYRDILADLSKLWIDNEVSHKVSKTASDLFWRISNEYFHRLYVARGNRGRKIPQFGTIRNKLYQDKVPKIKMEIGYMSKDTGEVTVVKDVSSTPVSDFPGSSHRRLYEIASVDVSFNILFNIPRLFMLKYLYFKSINRIYYPCKLIS